MKIVFSYLGIKKRFDFTVNVRKLIEFIVKEEKKKLGEVNIIFTSNQKILEINKSFLKHSYYTDVITFSNNQRDSISGDIYISLDKVNSNAARYRTEASDELVRVIIHGVLHLIGYDDKIETKRFAMRRKEDAYICRFRTNDIIDKSEFEL